MNLTDRLANERRLRLAAERKLDLKTRELFAANRKLSQHALSLSGQVIEQRQEAAELRARSADMQADLQRAEAHVAAVERRLWDSVETITDGFAVFDANDRLIAANTAWLSIFRFSERIGPGTPYDQVLRVGLEEGHFDIDGDEAEGWLPLMLARWQAPPPLEPVTLRTVGGDWFRFVDRRARDGDMVCLAQNVTALKERETELDEARHRAEAANRAKSAFLANMSHELRTPMNGVVGMAEMLLDGDLSDEGKLYASTIKSSGEALLQIINHVLDLSKIEAGRLTLHPAPFDLERLVHEVVTLLTPGTRGRDLRLHVDYDLFLPTRLVGDGMRIRQVLINLLGNAVKFTQEGHVLIRVVGFEAPDAREGAAGAHGAPRWRLHVTVEDTGIGIPPDMTEHVFGAFSQVEGEKNRSFEGTGLGLAITRQLVELMGGEIWVESEEGAGTCFGFGLTLTAAGPEDHAVPRIGPNAKRALIVADPGLDADILARQLGQLGLDVAIAASGADARALVAETREPMIAVLDEALADTGGPALARLLSAERHVVACLLVCGSAKAARKAEAETAPAAPGRAPVQAILTRPVFRADLFDALARLPHADDGSTERGADASTQSAETHATGDNAPDPASDAGTAGGPRRMRVLAAEDNRTNRLVLAKMLRHLEIDLHFAEDGEVAVREAARLKPDLIFMDISMPKRDGKEAARLIRAAEADAAPARRVPIVAMTAHAMPGDEAEIREAGIDGYLTKPLKRQRLEAEVLAHCPGACHPPKEAMAPAE